MGERTAERVVFGLFEFDLGTRELRREGVGVRLQAQPAHVLAALVERAGEVVPRETLRTTIWGGDTFVDFDKGLNFAIAQVRAALGDSADSPRFVRTHPRRGYEFIAPVRRLPAGPATAATAAPARRGMPASPAVLLAAAVLVLAGAWTWRAWRHAEIRRAHTVAVVPFDNETRRSDLDLFARTLSDTLVAQLAASTDGTYEIIGNAAALREPRDRRDLRAIGRTLGAGFVVIGQVQESGGRARVLAHLIRLPEQTHLGVVRVERQEGDPLMVESAMARRIADGLLERLPAGAPRPAR